MQCVLARRGIRCSDRPREVSRSNSASRVSGGSEQVSERVDVGWIGVADDDIAQAGLAPCLHTEASEAAGGYGLGQPC